MRNPLRTAVWKLSGALIPLALLYPFASCGSLQMKPLHGSVDTYDCYGDPDNGKTVFSPAEENLIRQGALKSRKLNMESGVGMMEKTARLYVLNRREFGLALHLAHPIDIEFVKYAFVIRGDSGTLAEGEARVDSRVTIGEITEEQLYLAFPSDQAARLAEDKRISIGFKDISFNLRAECRETFRDIRREIE